VRNQQQRRMQAYLDRNEFGLAGLGASQQQDAATVASSLMASAKLAKDIGGPIAGDIVAAAGALAQIISLFGPNPNNTITTGWVNQIEFDVLNPNLAAWQALQPAQKFYTLQQTAMNTFTVAWNQLLQLCNNASLGSAGTNCIADRQRGGKYDWWKLYYDPIANDPAVIPDPVAAAAPATTATGATPVSAVTGAVDSVVSSVSTATGFSPLILGLGLIGIALVVSD
jgi:hypothetical protein